MVSITKGYEWTNLRGGYLNNVNKWNHKEPYSLETIFLNQCKGSRLTISILKNNGWILKDVRLSWMIKIDLDILTCIWLIESMLRRFNVKEN